MRFTFYNIFFNLLNSLIYFLLFQPACLRREARICWNFGHPETTLFSNVQPQIITFTLDLLILILGVTLQSVGNRNKKSKSHNPDWTWLYFSWCVLSRYFLFLCWFVLVFVYVLVCVFVCVSVFVCVRVFIIHILTLTVFLLRCSCEDRDSIDVQDGNGLCVKALN